MTSGRIGALAAALLLLTSCSGGGADETTAFGGGGTGGPRRQYGAGDSRVLEATYFAVDDVANSNRRRYVAVVVCDLTEPNEAGYLYSSGGGCSMSARRVSCDFSREFYREYRVNHKKAPCHVTAWDWDSYYFNNTKHPDSAGRLFLWKFAADGTGKFFGPYPIAGEVSDDGSEIWKALDAAHPEYAPRG
jgi:hypothetical protein